MEFKGHSAGRETLPKYFSPESGGDYYWLPDQIDVDSVSGFEVRVISDCIASRGDLPSFRTPYICSVIGISTPPAFASCIAALVVKIPSATMPCIPATISGSFRPRPHSTPTPLSGESPPAQAG